MDVRYRINAHAVLICSYAVFALACLVAGKKAGLELSVDEGRNWQRHDKLREPVPAMSLLRPAGSSSVFVQVPRCALTSPLHVQIWRLDGSDEAFGMSWEGAGCDDIDKTSQTTEGTLVKPTFRGPKSIEPRWWGYIRERPSIEPTTIDDKKVKSKGFFAKYGLFIMVAIGFALAHGIRIGFAELQAEVQREEARAAAGANSARSRLESDSVHVVVPQTRKSVRQRKKLARGTATTSKHTS